MVKYVINFELVSVKKNNSVTMISVITRVDCTVKLSYLGTFYYFKNAPDQIIKNCEDSFEFLLNFINLNYDLTLKYGFTTVAINLVI